MGSGLDLAGHFPTCNYIWSSQKLCGQVSLQGICGAFSGQMVGEAVHDRAAEHRPACHQSPGPAQEGGKE